MCQRDNAGSEHDHPIGGWHGPQALCDRTQHNSIGQSAGPLHQHHCLVRVPQGRAHVGLHNPPRQDVDSGAAGRPCHVCWLHTLVPPRLARHLERVHLHTYHLAFLTLGRFRGASRVTTCDFFFLVVFEIFTILHVIFPKFPVFSFFVSFGILRAGRGSLIFWFFCSVNLDGGGSWVRTLYYFYFLFFSQVGKICIGQNMGKVHTSTSILSLTNNKANENCM